ncbi:MAG: sulfite exporter TauE/SafE family protein [Frankia sp.]
MTFGHTALLVVGGVVAGAVPAGAGGGPRRRCPGLAAAGLPPVVANVTNTVAVWPGYLSGAAEYRGQLNDDRGHIVELGGLALGGGVVGTVLLLTAPARVFHVAVPYLVLSATVLLASQPRLSRWASRRREGRPVGAGAAPGAETGAQSGAESGAESGAVAEGGVGWPTRAATFVAAIYGAYFGGGLGIVLLAVLALGLNADITRLNGLKTLLSLLINTVALVGFATFGPVNWHAVLLVAPASFLGGSAGARLALRINARTLRRAIVVFGCVIAVRLLLTS